MKKTLLKSFLIALSILLSFTAISCSGFNDANNGKAYIVFSNERTLYPTIDTNNFSSITLTGKLNSGAEQTLGTWSKVSDMSGTSIEIDTGSWSFTLSATAEGLVYSGTTEKTIELGANELSFTLKFSSYTPVSGSSGTLNYTLTFPSSRVAVVMAGLYDSEKKAAVTGYEEESLAFTTGAASASGTDKTISVSYSKTGVPSGNYYLSFGLFSDSDRTLKVGGSTEMIYIANGLSTTKTVALASVNNPYNITYNLNGGTLTGAFPASYTVYSGKITLPTEAEMIKTDCKFGGWYTTSDFTGTAITEISEGSSGDITLYANWITTVASITATLADSSHYELTSSTMAAPNISCFTITKTYKDGTSTTETPTSATEIINADGTKTTTGTDSSYTAAIPTTVTSNVVGNIPVTITLASTATLATPVTCTVEVPYKYTSVAPECNKATATAASIAQYTGTTTITTECKDSLFTTYSIYSSTGETMNLIDSVSYQWYSNTSNSTTGGTAISSATSSTYTTPTQTAAVYYYCVATTVCNGKDYCANASEALSSTSNPAEVAVVPYTMTFTKSGDTSATYTLSNSQSVSLTQGTGYTLALVNSVDSTLSTRTITWSATDTNFTISSSTLTVPSATATGVTLTASDGTNTLISVTIGTTASSLTLSKIEATYNGSALTASTDTTSLPDLASFTVVKTYSDNTTTTDSTATSDKYSIAWKSDEAWEATNVGNRTLTVTSQELNTVTTTVTIPYKHAMVAPTVVEITTTSPTIAQYTGSTTLTATATTTNFTSYTVYGETTSITDTVSYQWYSNTNSDNITGTAISGATSASYTVSAQEKEGTVYYYCVATTVSGNSTYCYNTSPSASSSANEITVTPWTMTLTDTTAKTTAVSLSSGASTSLTAGDDYTMSFANTGADTTGLGLANSSAYVAWKIGTEKFTTVSPGTTTGWTFKAPAATSAEQSCLFTATLTSGTATYTIGTFTGTVSAAATTGTTAITVTLAATSDINVTSSTDASKAVTLTADSDYGTYTWFINDAQQTSTTNVLTFTPATGVTYDVLLVAVSKTNGLTYSEDIQVKN